MFDETPGGVPDGRLSRYDHLIIHCTATPADREDVDAAWVDGVHRARGWRGCGYHAVITRAGHWQDSDGGYPTRPIGDQGAHVGDCGRGWNGRSFGVSLAGGVTSDGRTPEFNFAPSQMRALEKGVRHFLQLHPDPRSVTILGHRDLIRMTNASPKACPCFDVGEWLKQEAVLDGAAGSGRGLIERVVSALSPDEDGTDRDTPVKVPEEHVVEKDDTLWDLANRYGVPVERLMELNGDDDLRVGQRLRIG